MNKQDGLIQKIENNTFVRAIRGGLVIIIPVLMVGAFSLILQSFPVAAYQNFISHFAGGLFYNLFHLVYSATFGMLSVYMTLSVGLSMAKEYGTATTGSTYGAPLSALVAFAISVGFLTDSFSASSFSAVGMFVAILCGTAAPSLYLRLSKRFGKAAVFSDGADPAFNRAVSAIWPLMLVGLSFALLNFGICRLLGADNLWRLIELFFGLLFKHIGGGFFGGFVYIFSSSLMWFFGIHGSDVLESVNQNVFLPAAQSNVAAAAAGLQPTEIFTKTFFDVFVLIGGCGTLLALLIAVLLFSKRKSSRSLGRLAAVPMLFNINEIMVFGLPIIYNPIMFIPFICAPIASFLISAAAMYSGLVPLTTMSVEWTTPILLGGYRATGSVAGAVLQLVNVAVGVLIYMPFVKMYDARKESLALRNVSELVSLLQGSEKRNQSITLTNINGVLGDISKQFVNDMMTALEKNELYLCYQPQFAYDGTMVGAEALLRWNHSQFGMIYPPLIVKLASEARILGRLEKYVFLRAKQDIEENHLQGKISINLTTVSLKDLRFVEFLLKTFPDGRVSDAQICIEITEQTELVTDDRMLGTLEKLKEHGFLLAIDDFSMGFTSLKYLRESHFDIVKLDGSLVRGLTEESRSKEIIASIVYLSQSLGFTVLAEFVETAEQRDLLKEIGCLQYQGYLYSKPLDVQSLQAIEPNRQ